MATHPKDNTTPDRVYVMVSGSRTWRSRAAIHRAFRAWQSTTGAKNVTLVYGGAAGADRLSADVAETEMGWDLDLHLADWHTHGKHAGILRNLEMLAHDISHVFIFWDGQSRGTKHVIDQVQARRMSYSIERTPSNA